MTDTDHKMDATPSTSAGMPMPGAAEQDLPQSSALRTDPDEVRSTVAVAVFPKVLFLVDKKGAEDIELIKRRLIIDGDGTGDDKKLTKLTETYITLLNNVNDDNIHEIQEAITFKSLLKQTDAIRSNVAKTYSAIVANSKAVTYWNLINEGIAKEMMELRTIVLGLRNVKKMEQDKKKECQEREAFVKLLDQVAEREVVEKELKELKEAYQELQSRQTELDEKIKEKKTYLSYLFTLVKRLDSEEVEVVEDAITEAEEKVLSDVSMDLE